MPAQVINFTKASLTSISLPAIKKRVYYKDAQVKGLIIDVRSSGSKSFYLYKSINGRPERVLLGLFPYLSVENARKLAILRLSEVAMGKNPQEEKRRIRDEMTLGQLFERYMSRYSKLHKKSWAYDEREIPRFLSHWFKRRLSDIKRAEIVKLREQILADNGLYQSNRIVERIRALYNKAIEWGWEGTNPATGIKKYREKSRDRSVLPHELPFLIKALDEETGKTFKDYFWLLFLTGARKTNTIQMRWEQIDWHRCQWRIPDTKNGEPVNVLLVDRAVAILRMRKQFTKSPWVFAQEEKPDSHIVNVKRAWTRILERATLHLWKQDENLASWLESAETSIPHYLVGETGFKMIVTMAERHKVVLPTTNLLDIRIHDIRRTFGSYQALTGASLQVIGKSLGHKSIQATQIYARLNLDAVRASVEKATNAMFN